MVTCVALLEMRVMIAIASTSPAQRVRPRSSHWFVNEAWRGYHSVDVDVWPQSGHLPAAPAHLPPVGDDTRNNRAAQELKLHRRRSSLYVKQDSQCAGIRND